MVALKWTDFPEAQAVPEGAGLPAGALPCRPGVASGQTIRPRQASPTGQTRPTGRASWNGPDEANGAHQLDGANRPHQAPFDLYRVSASRRPRPCAGGGEPYWRRYWRRSPRQPPLQRRGGLRPPQPDGGGPFSGAGSVAVVAIPGIGAAVWAAGGRSDGCGKARSRLMPPLAGVYMAKPGDTIWGIAVRFSGNSDPRPLAYNLEAQIGGAVLQPGDQLTIPSAP